MSPLHIAFLGYDSSQTRLIAALEARGHRVTQTADRVTSLAAYDRVVSFGYRHILKADVLATTRHPALNLHMSYLPWNKGAHPNFWALVKATPVGVTLHEIATGLDTGPIVAQKQCPLDDSALTFRESYAILFDALETLFLAQLNVFEQGNWTATQQVGSGSYQKVADLPDWMTDWSMTVAEAKARYHDGP